MRIGGAAWTKEEGIEEGTISIAKKMLEKNMDIKDISEITGLSIEDISKLKETKFWVPVKFVDK